MEKDSAFAHIAKPGFFELCQRHQRHGLPVLCNGKAVYFFYVVISGSDKINASRKYISSSGEPLSSN